MTPCLRSWNRQQYELTGGTTGNCKWSFADGTLTISGSGKMEEYSSYEVAPWYSDRSTITSVVIGNGVTNIGSFAFYDCNSLISVIIPSTVTTIGAGAFIACTSLPSISIPSSVTTIGSYAFGSCSFLTTVLYGGTTVQNASSDAFFNCPSSLIVKVPALYDGPTFAGVNVKCDYCGSDAHTKEHGEIAATGYTITIDTAITNGTVTADKPAAAEGATVILTVTPAECYVLDTLTVTDGSGNAVTVTNNAFTMPASNVTVTAAFQVAPTTVTLYFDNSGTGWSTVYAYTWNTNNGNAEYTGIKGRR